MINNKIVITGGHGFIGSHLVKQLQKDNDIFLLPRNFKTIPLADYYFLLAAYGNKYNQINEDEMIKANVLLLWNLLKASKNIPYKAFINFSSSSTLLEYETFYSATKGAGERLVKAFVNKYDKPVVTVRPYSVYGPGDDLKHFIPVAIQAFKEDLELNVAPGEHDWIYIDDLVSGVLKVAENAKKLKGECVNIGKGLSQSNYGVISILQDIFQKHGKIKRVGQMREYDTRNWASDNTIIKSLGWKPEIDLEEGLERCVYGN